MSMFFHNTISQNKIKLSDVNSAEVKTCRLKLQARLCKIIYEVYALI